MDTHLLEILQNYGLSQKEAQVYLGTLEMGNASASVISRRSGIKRVTVYTIMRELMNKKIAQEVTKNDIKLYSVISPEKLFDIYEKRYNNFKQALPEFNTIHGKYGKKPIINFFEGEDSINQMLYDYETLRIESMGKYDQTRRGYSDPVLIAHYQEWLEHYRLLRVPNEKICLFSNHAEIEEEIGERAKKNNNRFIKHIPTGFTFTDSLWVVGDYIVKVNTSEKKHHAFQIHDAEFAKNLREVFKTLWSLTK